MWDLFTDKDGEADGEVEQDEFAVTIAGNIGACTLQFSHDALDIALVDKW